MKQVKIPIFFKILMYLFLFFLLTILIILPKSFQDIFWLYYILSFIATTISFILFFYVLKNNLLAIKLFSIFLCLNFGWINFISFLDVNIEIFYIIYFIFLFFVLFLFYFINRRIKEWVENLDLKYITEKQQHKTFLYTSIFTILFLIIFRFWYYQIENDIENLDDFFITKYQNIDIKDEDNLFVDIKNFNNFNFIESNRDLKQEILNCLYKDNCLGTFDDYKNNIEKFKNPEKYMNFEYLKNLDSTEDKIYVNTLKDYLKENIEKLSEIPGFKNSNIYNVMKNCIDNNVCEKSRDVYTHNIYKVKDLAHNSFDFKEKPTKEIESKKERILVKTYLRKNIDVLYVFNDESNINKIIDKMVNEWSNKKYYKSNYDEITIFTSFIWFNRELKHKILYYINSNNEKKAIEILQAQVHMLFTMLEWDGPMIETLTAITCLKIWFESIDFIINNYKWSDNFRNKLLSILDKEIDFSSMDNALKNDLKIQFDLIKDLKSINYMTLYNSDYTEKWFAEIWYNIIKNKWKIPEHISNKYKNVNFLKSNIIGQVLWKWVYDTSYESQYKKLLDLEKYRKNLAGKLK